MSEENCCCGHTEEDHKTASGSCRFNDGTDDGCLCGGFELECPYCGKSRADHLGPEELCPTDESIRAKHHIGESNNMIGRK